MRIPKSGDLVIIRRQRWRVVDVNRFPLCQLLSVVGAGTGNVGASRRFLTPFDLTLEADRPDRLRFVLSRRWRRACRALLARDSPPDALKTAGSARFDLWPHQLEPAMALTRGHGTRVLLADDVGLGKTIQAGLIVTELRARGLADRVLVLVPAGLRDQWAEELSSRFSIDTAVVDHRELRRRAAALPVGLNPWTTMPVAVTSVDYVKRPEVLAAVVQSPWDAVVVDEAHGAASDSERHEAVSRLASRAGYVVLLSATPHSGDVRAFEALCGIGSQGDPLLVFRRSRRAVASGTRRRVHLLRVRMSAAETRMHARLREFAQIVQAERPAEIVRLTLSVLHKRALSSPMSLARSVARRLSMLDEADTEGPRQLGLPLDDERGELDPTDDIPDWPADCGLADRNRERSLLKALSEAAAEAARRGRETKVEALLRLVRRIKEPVVVFTEFRDTLLHLRDQLTAEPSTLHGGLSRRDRRAALNDFGEGRTSVLLATDTGGEGLNLQQRCRVVVNLELPWNPIRLEQRVGRVDRIGQRRTVHAFHLVARASAEERIFRRLQSRIGQARHDIATLDPLVGDPTLATRVARGPEPARLPGASRSDRQSVDLGPDAAAEARRLVFVRRVTCSGDDAVLQALESLGGWVSRSRHPAMRCFLGLNALAFVRVEWEDGHGRVCQSMLAPIAIRLDSARARMDWRALRDALRAHQDAVQLAINPAVERTDHRLRAITSAVNDVQLSRQRALAVADAATGEVLWQAGLFDRRAERELSTGRVAVDGLLRERSRRILSLEQANVLTRRPARVLLALLP